MPVVDLLIHALATLHGARADARIEILKAVEELREVAQGRRRPRVGPAELLAGGWNRWGQLIQDGRLVAGAQSVSQILRVVVRLRLLVGDGVAVAEGRERGRGQVRDLCRDGLLVDVLEVRQASSLMRAI